MATGVQELLRSFESLSDDEKREVTLEVLRWWQEANVPPLTDEELTWAADDLFQQYDREEAQGA